MAYIDFCLEYSHIWIANTFLQRPTQISPSNISTESISEQRPPVNYDQQPVKSGQIINKKISTTAILVHLGIFLKKKNREKYGFWLLIDI